MSERNRQRFQRQARQVFNRLAAPTARYVRSRAHPEIRSDVAWMRPRHNDIVLDLACGPGTLARELARHTRTVLGLDLADAMVRRARWHAPANTRFTVGDAEWLPFPNQSFTLVTCSYSLANFLAPARIVAEMRRVLQPGGRVAVIEVVAPEDPIQRVWLHRLEQARAPNLSTHIPTLSEMLAVFQRAGLRLLDCRIRERRRRLRDWLRLSAKSETSARALHLLFLEAARNDRAGLRPRRRDGQWFFYHTVAQLLWQC